MSTRLVLKSGPGNEALSCNRFWKITCVNIMTTTGGDSGYLIYFDIVKTKTISVCTNTQVSKLLYITAHALTKLRTVNNVLHNASDA